MKGVIETVGDIDNPTASLTSTKSGLEIDLMNLTGSLKLGLIRNGEMDVDQFITPANMTGKKLQALRAKHREKMAGLVDLNKPDFKVGEMVTYKDNIHEVLKVRSDAVLLVVNSRKYWIPLDRVKKG
jgi:hypothetical protein